MNETEQKESTVTEVVEDRVNETIISLCDWVDRALKIPSSEELNVLPGVVESIAELIRALKY